MFIDELKGSFVELDTDARSYIEQNREYYQVKIFKILMKGITALTKMLFIGAMVLLTLLLLSIAIAIGISQLLNNLFYGFLIVTLFYVIIGVIFYIYRDKLDKPVLKKFSEYYFDDI